ncbi:MAG TPA: aconitate hydratase [Desulfobacteraceae bacterium]|nr:aconitate hydratase [Desulfobacteraceae bacterium]
MGKGIVEKILENHLIESTKEEIAIRIDQTLLQDATGTMAMLEFESFKIPKVKTELSVQYVDHNLLQMDNRNRDDHEYLRTASSKYGIFFSAPGNGICHQVHLERFALPGKTLLGSDSHTPTAGGMGMLAIGAGGLDVAMAMAGIPYYFLRPKIVKVELKGKLSPFVSAKDVVLELLRRFGVKGFLGKILEYCGEGIRSLSVPERATICNMGTELGATSSIFPSDEITFRFLKAQGREKDWKELLPEWDARYDESLELDLNHIEPLVACPSSPGNVVPVKELEGVKVSQVIVGSCGNSSFVDLMKVRAILKGRKIKEGLSFHINPGSRQILEEIIENGCALSDLIKAGARIHEPGCHGCIGMGQAPGMDEVSLRTFPRNFPGRSGTPNDRVYLCSPETGAASALKGEITDPRALLKEMEFPQILEPDRYIVDTSLIYPPSEKASEVKVIKRGNIKSIPPMQELEDNLVAHVGIKLGDNISTDEIIPGGSKVLPLRSDIHAISRYVFGQIDPEFVNRCEKMKDVAVVGGENYGQGSSREHAALAPRYLGVRVKLTKGFARIHKANLCNFGIIPLVFEDPSDYELLKLRMKLIFPDIKSLIKSGEERIPVKLEDGKLIYTRLNVSERQRKYLIYGSALNYVRYTD